MNEMDGLLFGAKSVLSCRTLDTFSSEIAPFLGFRRAPSLCRLMPTSRSLCPRRKSGWLNSSHGNILVFAAAAVSAVAAEAAPSVFPLTVEINRGDGVRLTLRKPVQKTGVEINGSGNPGAYIATLWTASLRLNFVPTSLRLKQNIKQIRNGPSPCGDRRSMVAAELVRVVTPKSGSSLPPLRRETTKKKHARPPTVVVELPSKGREVAVAVVRRQERFERRHLLHTGRADGTKESR